MVLGVLYAWSIFRQPLGEMFPGWTPVDMSWVFTITMLGFLSGGVVSGRLMLKIPPRFIVLMGSALLFVGFFGASRIDSADSRGSLLTLYIFYGICCGFGIGMPYNAILSAMLKWFPGREGIASGVMLMGFGFGGLALGSAIGGLISSFGLNTAFVILAIGMTAIMTGGSFVIKTPKDAATGSPASTPAPESDSDRTDYTPMQMVHAASFPVLVLWTVAGATAGLMVMGSAATMAVFYGASAGIGLLATVFNGLGRIFFGVLSDRFGSRSTMAVCGAAILASGILMLSGSLNGYLPLILVGMPLAGLGYGGSPVTTAAFVNRKYGSTNYAANLSIVNFSVIAASVAGPLLSGRLQEMEGGGFSGTFIAIAALGLAAILLSFFIKQRKRTKIT
jgi:OFA family oxalate/formate antiporter-like MFS transporter